MRNDGVERRLFPRKRMRTRVVFKDEFGEGLIWVNSEDISLGGLFLSSDIPIRAGSYAFLSFRLPDSSVEVSATGQVVRVLRAGRKDGSPAVEGFGVRFVGLSGDAVKAIQDFIS